MQTLLPRITHWVNGAGLTVVNIARFLLSASNSAPRTPSPNHDFWSREDLPEHQPFALGCPGKGHLQVAAAVAAAATAGTPGMAAALEATATEAVTAAEATPAKGATPAATAVMVAKRTDRCSNNVSLVSQDPSHELQSRKIHKNSDKTSQPPQRPCSQSLLWQRTVHQANAPD